MKRGRYLAILLAAGCMMTGCSSFGGFSPEVSGVSISKKGAVTEVIREMFDESAYSKEELEQQMNSEIEAYNTAAGDDCVKKKSLKVKDGVAQMRIAYASVKDYIAFNDVEFYAGDIVGAVQQGYMFEGVFKSVTGGTVDDSSSIWGSAIISKENDAVVVFDGPLLVDVPGEIKYVSENVHVTEKNTGVCSDSDRAYIIYNAEQ